jgi:hypothetical protein
MTTLADLKALIHEYRRRGALDGDVDANGGVWLNLPWPATEPEQVAELERVTRLLEPIIGYRITASPGIAAAVIRPRADFVSVGDWAEWATQNYVAGRLAARARLAPACGNFLHHAVELYLKGALSGVLSLKDMKDAYGHNLEKLWQRFKVKEADPTLDSFDATIAALHKLEDIRYPDEVRALGATVSVAWRAADTVQVSGLTQPPKYEIVISDVDRLVIKILKSASVDPKSLSFGLERSGRGALQYKNPHAARWFRRRIAPPRLTANGPAT